MSDENSDQDIKDLVDQLKDTTTTNNKVCNSADQLSLDPQDVEQFVTRDQLQRVMDFLLALKRSEEKKN